MLSLFNADWFRIRKTKTYFVLVCLMVAAMIIGVVSIVWLNDVIISQGGFATEYIPINTFVDNIGMINNAIFSSVTFALIYFSDYVNRQVSKMVTAGYSRISIFAEKLIMYLMVVTSYYLIITVVSFAIQLIIGEPLIAADNALLYYFRTYFLQMVMAVTLFCFLFLIGNLVNKTAPYYVMYFAFTMFASLFTDLVSLFIFAFFKVEVSLSKYIFTTYTNIFVSASDNESLVLGIIVCLVTAAVCGTFGLMLFKRKELK